MHPNTEPEVRLVRAANTGPLTGTGTNTWIVGRGDVAVIDPGPADDAHLSAIMAALAPGERISHILVTHTHLDHSALVPALAARTGAITAGFGSATTGRSPRMQMLAALGLGHGGEGIDQRFVPDLALTDGDCLAGDSWHLQAIHTPGHAASHLCFAAGAHLFSGDHVMGWSSSLISPPDGDMADYMRALEKLAQTPWHRALPGHGPVITAPQDRIAALKQHRINRETALLAALCAGPMRLHALTAAVYTDVAPSLQPAASRNVLAHVIDLHDRNLISCDDLCQPDPYISPMQSFPV
jgi:glyoxylase-like metal-dependent hydrolase (beta-lactamase superfamily II)